MFAIRRFECFSSSLSNLRLVKVNFRSWLAVQKYFCSSLVFQVRSSREFCLESLCATTTLHKYVKTSVTEFILLA